MKVPRGPLLQALVDLRRAAPASVHTEAALSSSLSSSHASSHASSHTASTSHPPSRPAAQRAAPTHKRPVPLHHLTRLVSTRPQP